MDRERSAALNPSPERTEMDIETIKLVVQVGQFVLTSAVGFYVYLVNKDRVTNERISKLENGLDGRLDDHADRIARLEERAKHAPTHDDLGELHEKINSVNEHLKTLSGEFTTYKGLLNAIHDFIMKGGKVS